MVFLSIAFCDDVDEMVVKLTDVVSRITQSQRDQSKIDLETIKELNTIKTHIKTLIRDNQKAMTVIVQEIKRYANTKTSVPADDPNLLEQEIGYIAFSMLVDTLRTTDQDKFIELSKELLDSPSVRKPRL